MISIKYQRIFYIVIGFAVGIIWYSLINVNQITECAVNTNSNTTIPHNNNNNNMNYLKLQNQEETDESKKICKSDNNEKDKDSDNNSENNSNSNNNNNSNSNSNSNNNIKKYSHISEPSSFPDHYMDYDPTVCVIIRTYSGHKSSLPGLISSLASNDYPNLHLYLVDTVGDFHDLSLFSELYNLIYGREFVHVSNVTTKYARSRFPKFTEPDFGYLQTDLLMEQLSAEDHPTKCSYFIATNGDNLYSRSLVYLTLEYMREDYDLIGFHFLSHYCYDEPASWRPRPGCYSQHYTEFVFQRIDIGSALIRKKRLLEKNANFIMNDLKRDPTGSQIQVHFCDGYFYESFAVNSKTIVINATLFVHQ